MALPESLSAKFISSFAYKTIKDRLPIILTKVIDMVYRMKIQIAESHGQEGVDELKVIAGRLAKLRNEMQTDKPLIPLTEDGEDVSIWNSYLQEKSESKGSPPSWFCDPWLYVECYMYRRIQQAFNLSPLVSSIDPFRAQKENSFCGSENAIVTLLAHLKTITETSMKDSELKTTFYRLLQVSLWGNKVDLSISSLEERTQDVNPLVQLDSLRPNILVDNSQDTWQTIQRPNSNRIDIILDNAGFELIGDLVLAEFLLASNFANVIYLHGKAMPWFVSDVTQHDLDWTMKALSKSDNSTLVYFGNKWQERLEKGSFVFTEHLFWTLPHDYSLMKSAMPELYNELGKAKIVILKGDLNYRKLTGDRQWDTTTRFDVALQGFHPAPVVSLRTLKADVQVGLKPGQAEECRAANENWMVTGEYAVIQFSSLVL
ncbi:damage-control phosphatase ARMT1-like [Lineus longissimus]|uniref:damage-control phosphatase ARMT1-like n=1 Tax=Lineus longissimus TaxID=88925 RepID=UPI002B4CC655